MSLQRRLTWLLAAFAGFATLATGVTVYAVRLHVEGALTSVQRTHVEADWIERLRLGIRQQQVQLHEILTGLGRADKRYEAQREAYFDELRQVAQFTLGQDQGGCAEQILGLTAQLRSAFGECVALAGDSRADAARQLYQERIERELAPALDLQLKQVQRMLDDSRSAAVDAVVATNTQVLLCASVIAVIGVTLVAVGTILLRRWVLMPIRNLERATREFARGNLAHRVAGSSQDELGALGAAMNRMAETLTETQEDLRVSEAKYRSLFDNLRDAMIICDEQARIIECRDGETGLLGRIAHDCEGRSLVKLWPADHALSWSHVIGQVLANGERVRATDVRLHAGGDPQRALIVDLIAFPLRLGARMAVAIVLRDVTEQRRSERQVRRTEAMEATVTLARGVAHDFSSLLTSAIASLSQLSSVLGDGRSAELAGKALRACGQAVSLSRTLLTFAGGDPGNPERLNLSDTVELILESLDESWFDKTRLETDLDRTATVIIDRDQFTEIVLNLTRNACEAMGEGGELRIAVQPGKLPSAADTDGPSTHAVLTVADTGCGISPDVQERLFEPFVTTKEHGQRRSRGMGLAVVYAAVKNAGGVIQAWNRPEAGATFCVWLPLAEPDPVGPRVTHSQTTEC